MVDNYEKMKKMFWLCNKWLYLKNMGIQLTNHTVFKDNDKIAIYGLGEIGKRLIEELENNHKPIMYVLDKRAKIYFGNFDLYTVNEEFPDVDAMIITPISEFDIISDMLRKRISGSIVSLENIIDDLCINSYKGIEG